MNLGVMSLLGRKSGWNLARSYLHNNASAGDNVGMDEIDGFGVGTSVGLGTLIGLGIVAPDAEILAFVATFVFYGGIAGLLFELYRFAFTYKAPMGRR